MTDPITGASAAIQGLQKLQQTSQANEAASPSKAASSDGPSFKDVMQQQTDQAQGADSVQGPQAPQKTEPIQKPQGVEPNERLDNFVKGVFKDEKQISRMMSRCSRGKTLDQGELLQMQGLIYSYGQKIDLASKLVDKATGGVKQIMNTQV